MHNSAQKLIYFCILFLNRLTTSYVINLTSIIGTDYVPSDVHHIIYKHRWRTNQRVDIIWDAAPLPSTYSTSIRFHGPLKPSQIGRLRSLHGSIILLHEPFPNGPELTRALNTYHGFVVTIRHFNFC